MSIKPISLPSRPVLLAVALALLGIANSLGPINTAMPAAALEAVILYIVIGVLLIASQYAPAQLRNLSTTHLVSGSVLLTLGLFLLGQGQQLLNTNVFVAGVYFLAGGVLILIGTIFPSGFLHKAIADFQESN